MNVTTNETLFKSDKVCRLCLSRKRVMLPIFYEDETSFPMASRILTYVGIEVSFRLLCCSFETALYKECYISATTSFLLGNNTSNNFI